MSSNETYTTKEPLMSDREACHVEPTVKTATAAEQSQVETVVLAVWGMGCPNCAVRVRNCLLGVYGVLDADVVHTFGVAQVLFNPSLASPDQLVTAVAEAGGDGRHIYRAELVEASRP
jgi:copper chaperone CopZ